MVVAIREYDARTDVRGPGVTSEACNKRQKQQTASDVKENQDNQEAFQRLSAKRATMVMVDMLEERLGRGVWLLQGFFSLNVWTRALV